MTQQILLLWTGRRTQILDDAVSPRDQIREPRMPRRDLQSWIQSLTQRDFGAASVGNYLRKFRLQILLKSFFGQTPSRQNQREESEWECVIQKGAKLWLFQLWDLPKPRRICCINSILNKSSWHVFQCAAGHPDVFDAKFRQSWTLKMVQGQSRKQSSSQGCLSIALIFHTTLGQALHIPD